MTQFNETYRKCIEACQECILRCEECIKGMAAGASDNDCPVCCHECLQLFQLCLRAMAGDSRNVKDTCALCAQGCEGGAEQCGGHSPDHCRRCAEACPVRAAEWRQHAA